MKFRIFLVSLILLFLTFGYLIYQKVEILEQTINNQQSKIDELKIQNTNLTEEKRVLRARLGNVEWNYGQDKKRYENRIETFIENIDEIDKVNSDFELYGESRFQEGFIKAFFVSCLFSGYPTKNCLANVSKMYNDKFWETVDTEEWDRLWDIIRGINGVNF